MPDHQDCCVLISGSLNWRHLSKCQRRFTNTHDPQGTRTSPTAHSHASTTSVGFANNTIKQKQSKAIDMRFYWIRDCTRHGHLKIYWSPGSTNLGDYHNKHHFPSHHQLMRPQFLHDEPHVQLSNLVVMHPLRGCVNSRKMCAVRAEPGITTRTHITAVKPFKPVFVTSHTHKLINNVFISYNCQSHPLMKFYNFLF